MEHVVNHLRKKNRNFRRNVSDVHIIKGTVPSEYIKQVLMRGTVLSVVRAGYARFLKQRLMQEPEQSVSKQSMVREVQAGRLTD